MHKLHSVESAKALLTEAKDWGVWRWLTEKKRVRAAADSAWADLEEVERKLKAAWSDDLRKAYRAVDGKLADASTLLTDYARHLKREDEEAFQARMNAEDTFDEAEKQMSVALARKGSEQAVAAF